MIQKMFINSFLEPRSHIQGGLKPDLLLIKTEYRFARRRTRYENTVFLIWNKHLITFSFYIFFIYFVIIFSMSISDIKAKYRVITVVSFVAWNVTRKCISPPNWWQPNQHTHTHTLAPPISLICSLFLSQSCQLCLCMTKVWCVMYFWVTSHASNDTAVITLYFAFVSDIDMEKMLSFMKK